MSNGLYEKKKTFHWRNTAKVPLTHASMLSVNGIQFHIKLKKKNKNEKDYTPQKDNNEGASF